MNGPDKMLLGMTAIGIIGSTFVLSSYFRLPLSKKRQREKFSPQELDRVLQQEQKRQQSNPALVLAEPNQDSFLIDDYRSQQGFRAYGLREKIPPVKTRK